MVGGDPAVLVDLDDELVLHRDRAVGLLAPHNSDEILLVLPAQEPGRLEAVGELLADREGDTLAARVEGGVNLTTVRKSPATLISAQWALKRPYWGALDRDPGREVDRSRPGLVDELDPLGEVRLARPAGEDGRLLLAPEPPDRARAVGEFDGEGLAGPEGPLGIVEQESR